MTPEEKARLVIDEKLRQSGWVIQDMKKLNLSAALGVAVREFPTSTGEVDYALFIDGKPVGVAEAKREEKGESITDVEVQSGRYANSVFIWIKNDYKIRFAYEYSDKLIRFTDYNDIKYRSSTVFSVHRPETLLALLGQSDTIRNNMKHFPALDETGFRKCQVNAIKNLDKSFAENRPKALVQMATGAGKTFTAITAAYRLLKYGKMNRILFLVDTRGLGEQAEREFLAYTPNDDPRSFSQLYGVRRLKSSYIPNDIQICICTIQRMYSILKGEELDESIEEKSFAEFVTAESKAPKEVVYNEKYPPEFFDCIIVDECQFLTESQIDQLRALVNDYNIPVMCFGLRTDIQTRLFPGSRRLMEVADTIQEIKTICDCGAKATVNARIDGDGHIITQGAQVVLGGNDSYIAMCHKCYIRGIREHRVIRLHGHN